MRSNRRRVRLIVLAAAAVLVAGIAGIAFLAGKHQNAQSTVGIIVDEDASEWKKELEDASGGQEGIKIPGYGEIMVAAGSTIWQITLANPEDNQCYFKYTVTIGEEDTPVYESDWIEPGKAVTEFEVTEALDAGDYEIHLNISACTMDESHTLLNGADVKAVLHVI